MPPH
jgi:tRNA threonylcarbamoyl adenosine modification protein (Sua5/YciO/YrdC/YwlC family)